MIAEGKSEVRVSEVSVSPISCEGCGGLSPFGQAFHFKSEFGLLHELGKPEEGKVVLPYGLCWIGKACDMKHNVFKKDVLDHTEEETSNAVQELDSFL